VTTEQGSHGYDWLVLGPRLPHVVDAIDGLTRALGHARARLLHARTAPLKLADALERFEVATCWSTSSEDAYQVPVAPLEFSVWSTSTDAGGHRSRTKLTLMTP